MELDQQATRSALALAEISDAAEVIAREYGIPVAVGTGDATRRLRAGLVVTVDRSTGTVDPRPVVPSQPPGSGPDRPR